jgi:hypothetical protein
VAVRFDAHNDRYSATTGLPAGQVWSATCWVYCSADRNLYSNAFALTDGTNYISAGFGANGTIRYLGWEGGDLVANAAPTNTAVGGWSRLGVTCNGTTLTLYWADATGPLLSRSGTGIPGSVPTSLTIGSDQFASYLNGRVAAFKMWDATLTAAEIDAELGQYQPARTANLLRYHPFRTAETTDYSGNGRTLTAGTATTEDGPPIRWGRSRSPRVKKTAVPPPGDVLNIGAADAQHFSLQAARPGDADIFLKTQAEIAAGYSESPYFYTTADGLRVHFEARLDAPTTPGSSFSRCELREVNPDGSDTSWNPLSGEHVLEGTTVITSLPPVKPDVVIAQAFGETVTADIMSLRTQLVSGTVRLRARVDGVSITAPQIAAPYTVGTSFNWRMRLTSTAREFYWSFGTDPLPGTPQISVAAGTETAAYFKAGLYNQSNIAAGDAGTAIGAAEHRNLAVTHIAPTFTTHNGAATLSASGDLTAGAAPGRPGAATLTGAGALTAAATQDHRASTTLTGAGALAAGTSHGQTGAAALAGSGNLTAMASRIQPTAATLAAVAALTATATVGQAAAATLAGTGGLSASAGQTGTATLAATGALTAAVQQTFAAAATLAGTGGLAAAASRGQTIAATLAGGGTLAVDATAQRPAGTVLDGAGTLSATAVRGRPASVALHGQGELSADARLSNAAQATLIATGTLTAGGTPERAGAAILDGVAGLVAAATANRRVGALLAATGTLTAGATRSLPAAVSLDGAGALTAAGTRVRPAGATLTGGGTLSTAGTRLQPAAVALAAAGQLIASAVAAAGGVLNPSLWAVHPTTGALIPLPHFVKLTVVPVKNAVGQITVEYPAYGRNADVLRVLVDNDRDLEVEIWLGGKRADVLRGILTDTSGDDVAEDAVNSYSGTFLELLLDEVLIWPQDADEKKELVFASKNAGEQAATVLGQAQARGGLVGVTRDFTTTLDSSGYPWPTTVNIKYSPTATFLEMLQELVDLGMIDAFELTAARVLRMWAPGRYGVDRTVTAPPVTFRRGRNLTESPRRHSTRTAGTTALIAGSEGVYRSASDATALARRGRRIELAGSANNLSDVAAVQAYAQNYLTTVTSGTLEVTHGLAFGTGHPRPLTHFRVGDWVWSDTRNRLERLRVYQWSLIVEAGAPSGELVLNTPKVDALLAIARKLKRISSGAEVVGTSQPPATEDKLAPAAPTGVTADSIAYQDGSDTYATVLVGWTAVTTNSDATAADDVSGYRVEWRTEASGGNGWQLGKDQGGGASASTSFGGVEAGVDIRIRVAAYDTNGNTSAWSDQVIINTETDTSAPPIPSTPTSFSRLGVLMVEWDGRGSAGEPMPADFDYVEVHVSAAAGFTPTGATYYDRLYGAGTMPVVDQPFGAARYFKLVAVDRTTPTPNRSGASGQATATASKVVSDDLLAGCVGSLALANLAVKTANIDLLAVNTAQVGELSVGRLSTGTFTSALTLSGIFRTGTGPNRGEWDPTSFRMFSGGVQTIGFVPGGVSFITGEFRTALTGQRVVWNPGGSAPDEARIFPSGGGDFARIMARTAPADGSAALLIDGGAAAGTGRGRVGVYRGEAFVSYVTQDTGGDSSAGYSRTAVSCNNIGVNIWAQNSIAFDKYSGSNFLDGSHAFVFWTAGSSSDYAPGFGASTPNAMVKLDGGRLLAVTSDSGAFIPVKASAFEVSSTETVKTEIVDIRHVLTPLDTLRAARTRGYKLVDEVAEMGEAAPIHFGQLAEELPAELVRTTPKAGGAQELSVNLADQLGLALGAVNQILDQEIVAVSAIAVLPATSLPIAGIFTPGATVEVDVAWDSTPPVPPTGGFAQISSAFIWAGKVTAWVKTGSCTAAGCRVVFKNISTSTVVVSLTNDATRVVATVTGLGLYSPPYTPPGA